MGVELDDDVIKALEDFDKNMKKLEDDTKKYREQALKVDKDKIKKQVEDSFVFKDWLKKDKN